MRKAAFLLVMIFTLYLAGMFRYPALMAVFIAECVLLLFCLFTAAYSLTRISVSFPVKRTSALCGLNAEVLLTLEDRSRLPVSDVRIQLKTRYAQEKRGSSLFLHTAAKRGTRNVSCKLTADLCGSAEVTIARIRVYDWLSLFSFSKRVKGQRMVIDVLPYAGSGIGEIPEALRTEGEAEELKSVRGQGGNEVYQIRPYMEGDSARHIHRPVSARMDDLYVREFAREERRHPEVLFDADAAMRADVSLMHRMYMLLHEILVIGREGEEGAVVTLRWYDGAAGAMQEAEVASEADEEAVYPRLYALDAVRAGRSAKAVSRLKEACSREGRALFVLDRDALEAFSASAKGQRRTPAQGGLPSLPPVFRKQG